MWLIALTNKFLKKFKGDGFSLDPQIPGSYLISLLFARVLMLIRGKTSFIKNKGLFFIGPDVKIHAKSLIKVGKGVTIDRGCFIDALSTNGISMGNNVSLGKRTVIECSGSIKHLGKGITIEDNVGLGRDCFYGCAGGIEIGHDTIIGNYVSFHSENHNTSDLTTAIRLQGVNHKGIKIGSDCWIGAKATILDGVVLGNGCIIAAGAILKAGVYEANTIYGGVPAKVIKRR